MNNRNVRIGLVVGGIAAAFVVSGAVAYAAPSADCPNSGIQCPMVWDPVICNDGVVYSNKCVARQHCAKGCVAYDDGIIQAGAKKRPGGGGDGCPREGIFCADIWDPVICDDGQVYSNDCYAWVACATGCVPYGDDGPIVVESTKANCDRPRFCPELWAPVICDDGRVYPNDCYAQKKCATGCEPYGDLLAAGGNCDRPRFCPELWAPVICDDGKVYPNDCYAQKKCATGCEPYGEWLIAAGGTCDRPKICPMLWAPVICDDGKVYPNDCYAQKKCATGCEPYGDLLAGGDKKKPPVEPPPDKCPRTGWACPDVWDPVICDNGQIYSNGCYAWVDCATGCVPYGDDGTVEAE